MISVYCRSHRQDHSLSEGLTNHPSSGTLFDYTSPYIEEAWSCFLCQLEDRSNVRLVLREAQIHDPNNDIGTELPHCIGGVESAWAVGTQGGQAESRYILPISQCGFILVVNARVSSAASKESDAILIIVDRCMRAPSGKYCHLPWRESFCDHSRTSFLYHVSIRRA